MAKIRTLQIILGPNNPDHGDDPNALVNPNHPDHGEDPNAPIILTIQTTLTTAMS